MILYFADRSFNIIGQASTTLPNGYIITDDKKTEDVASGINCFECTMAYETSQRSMMENMAQAGNYLLRSSESDNEFYTIIDSEFDNLKHEVYIYCEDVGLDLLNVVVPAYEADKAYNLKYYLDKWLSKGWEIGINAIPESRTRKCAWEGESTLTERLQSLCSKFKADNEDAFELTFTYDVEGLKVVKKYVNFNKKRGKDVNEQLRLNDEINSIITKKSVANLATAFACTGAVPKGKTNPITLSGYTYDDGDFYVSGSQVRCRSAMAKWKGAMDTDGLIVKRYSYETTSQATLCSHAIAELKKYIDFEINYEVDIARMPEGVKIGDRINIIDDAGEFYLSTRILQLETSVTREKIKAVLGEYKLKDSGISSTLQNLANSFESLVKRYTTWIAYATDNRGSNLSLSSVGKTFIGFLPDQTEQLHDVEQITDPLAFEWHPITARFENEAVFLQLASDSGYAFVKNAHIHATVNASVFNGNDIVTTQEVLKDKFGDTAYFKWYQQNGTRWDLIGINDTRLSQDGFFISLNTDDIDTVVKFKAELIVDGVVLTDAVISLYSFAEGMTAEELAKLNKALSDSTSALANAETAQEQAQSAQSMASEANEAAGLAQISAQAAEVAANEAQTAAQTAQTDVNKLKKYVVPNEEEGSLDILNDAGHVIARYSDKATIGEVGESTRVEVANEYLKILRGDPKHPQEMFSVDINEDAYDPDSCNMIYEFDEDEGLYYADADQVIGRIIKFTHATTISQVLDVEVAYTTIVNQSTYNTENTRVYFKEKPPYKNILMWYTLDFPTMDFTGQIEFNGSLVGGLFDSFDGNLPVAGHNMYDGASYQRIGNILICWGTVDIAPATSTTSGGITWYYGSKTVKLPTAAYKYEPESEYFVFCTLQNSSNIARTVSVYSKGTNSFAVRLAATNKTEMPIAWVSIGFIYGY